MRNNHCWKRKEKFVSKPCQFFKKFLSQNNIKFCQQYDNPQEWRRKFSIDIAFIEERIGIEINGNQHYESNGKLKPYYQQRHDILESFGWQIIEVPYLKVFDDEFKRKILEKIKEKVKCNFDYAEFVKKRMQQKKKRYICERCGKRKKTKQSKKCVECVKYENKLKAIIDRKITKEQLEKLIDEFPFVKIAKMYNVSDVTIKKMVQEIWYRNRKQIRILG